VAPDLTLALATFPTPIGPLTVAASSDGIVATSAGDADELAEDLGRQPGIAVVRGGRNAALRDAGRELERYFVRRLRAFTTPVDLRLARTPFARSVLDVTRSIPYGELWTYGDVAGGAGRPRAARAAGSVLAHSPMELFIPCHRVVPAGPGFGFYGGADDRRAFLLRLERAI
jgi:methylated-DNA-[protein]-cysteine S-methyltransferase